MRRSCSTAGMLSVLSLMWVTTSGCTTTGTTVIQTPNRITYHSGKAGSVDRVEERDAKGVCRRMLYYTDEGALKLLQERDAKGVCRRATYYDARGRVTRIETHDENGISQNVLRFDQDGARAPRKTGKPQTHKGGQP